MKKRQALTIYLSPPVLKDDDRQTFINLTANLLTNELIHIETEYLPDPQEIAFLVYCRVFNLLTATQVKACLPDILTGIGAFTSADELGFFDEIDIDPIIDNVLKNNTKIVDEYRAGKTNSINSLIGKVMKISKGKVDAILVKSKIIENIENKLYLRKRYSDCHELHGDAK